MSRGRQSPSISRENPPDVSPRGRAGRGSACQGLVLGERGWRPLLPLEGEGQGGRTSPAQSDRKLGESAPFLGHALKDGSCLPFPLTPTLKGSRERGAEGRFVFGQASETSLLALDVFTDFCSSHQPSPWGLQWTPPNPPSGKPLFTVSITGEYCYIKTQLLTEYFQALWEPGGRREVCLFYGGGSCSSRKQRSLVRLGGPRSRVS